MKKNLRIQRKEKRRQENRQYILEAAEEIFAAKGFAHSSVDDIANESQFSKATIYRYFESKLDIFSAVILNSFREARDEIEKIRDKPAGAESKLKDMIVFILRYYQRKQNITRIFFMEQEVMKKVLGMDMKTHIMPYGAKKQIPENFRKIVQSMFQSTCAIIQEGVSSGEFRELEAEEAASIFGAMLRGFHFKGPMLEKTYSVEESADLLLGYFLNGIRRKEE